MYLLIFMNEDVHISYLWLIKLVHISRATLFAQQHHFAQQHNYFAQQRCRTAAHVILSEWANQNASF